MSDLSQNDVIGNLDARIDELESQNRALQEALKRAWTHEEESHAYCSAFSPALERAALSPTQETDPE